MRTVSIPCTFSTAVVLSSPISSVYSAWSSVVTSCIVSSWTVSLTAASYFLSTFGIISNSSLNQVPATFGLDTSAWRTSVSPSVTCSSGFRGTVMCTGNSAHKGKDRHLYSANHSKKFTSKSLRCGGSHSFYTANTQFLVHTKFYFFLALKSILIKSIAWYTYKSANINTGKIKDETWKCERE